MLNGKVVGAGADLLYTETYQSVLTSKNTLNLNWGKGRDGSMGSTLLSHTSMRAPRTHYKQPGVVVHA